MAVRTEGSDVRLQAGSIIPFINDLVRSDDRRVAARALAQRLGAEECLICVRDPEIDQLLPAHGFPQTLPDRRAWQLLLSDALRTGQAAGRLPSPSQGGLYEALGVGVPPDVVCVLLMGTGTGPGKRSPEARDLEELRLLLPLVSATLSTERALDVARVHAAQSHRIAEEHHLLVNVLDGARRTLQEALADAQAQRALVQVQAAELEAMLQALPDALVVYDADGVVTRANWPARTLYRQIRGAPPERTQDCDLVQLLWRSKNEARTSLVADDGEMVDIVQRALQGQAAATHVLLLGATAQEPAHHYMVHTAPIVTESGDYRGAVAVATDISMLYALEAHKEEFLSIVSHELRTPLTTLRMHSQLLERYLSEGMPQMAGARQPQVLQMIPRMVSAVRRMERLVGDLLDTSRIQAGKLEMRLVRCDLSALCRQSVEEQMSLSPHPVVWSAPPDAAVWVMGDPDRLTQVVMNLLGNAVKYSPVGVPVRVCLRTDGLQARVSVEDAGPGIAADRQTLVFDRFFRIPETRIQQGSSVGLGLGLYIAKTIVESHGGTIGVESQVGEGTTFWFSLPQSE